MQTSITINTVIIMSNNILWGTHNTMSYMRPKNFLGKLIRWTSQCQSLTLEEQLDAGVRAFDIRIRFDSKGNPILCHGLVDYPGDLFGVLEQIAIKYTDTGKLVYVRLILESFITSPSDKDKKLFKYLCDYCANHYYLFVRWYFAIKKPWTIISTNIKTDIKECFKSPSTLIEVLKGPKRLLPLQEKRLVKDEELSRKTIVFIDFFKQ